jgi:hypothetical protein
LLWKPEIHMCFFFSLVDSRKEIELRVSDSILEIIDLKSGPIWRVDPGFG